MFSWGAGYGRGAGLPNQRPIKNDHQFKVENLHYVAVKQNVPSDYCCAGILASKTLFFAALEWIPACRADPSVGRVSFGIQYDVD